VAGRDDRCDQQGRPRDLAVAVPQRTIARRGEAGGQSLRSDHARRTHQRRPDQREEASGLSITRAAESAGLRRTGQLLRDLPRVAARIGEGERAHTPVTVCRAADYRHLMLIQLGAYCIHVLDEDDELPDSFLRQAEHVA